MIQKNSIRRRVLIARRLMSDEDKKNASIVIADSLLKRAEIVKAQTICIYISLPEEVDTRPIIVELFRLRKTVVVPKVSGNRLTLHEILSFNDLQTGVFGILEPSEHGTGVLASSVDVFIVPGVVFDTQCFRIGWGKGYYDRLLVGVEGFRIGLAYSCQVVAEVPHTSYDIPMHCVITEKEEL